MFNQLSGLLVLVNLGLNQPADRLVSPLAGPVLNQPAVLSESVVGQRLALVTLDLNKRHPDPYINQVFVDNIRLAVKRLAAGPEPGASLEKAGSEPGTAYLETAEPVEAVLVLEPGQVFAFHENVLTEYQGRISQTMASRFNPAEGYRSSGFIYGDGVCHLASLLYWGAVEAGLAARADVPHDFRPSPGIPREYGISVKYQPVGLNSQRQNLYIENRLKRVSLPGKKTLVEPVSFRLWVENNCLKLAVTTKP